MTHRADVFCRVRPTDKLCLQQFYFNPNKTSVHVTRTVHRCLSNGGKGGNDQQMVQNFTFDSIFAGSSATQENVFRETTVKLVQKGLLEGINGTLLCHGQRDSGKTYTMFGGNDYRSRGLVVRAITQIYEDIQRYSMERTYTIRLSFLQFYGEEVTDLLTGMSSAGISRGGNNRAGSKGRGSSNSGRTTSPGNRLGTGRQSGGSGSSDDVRSSFKAQPFTSSFNPAAPSDDGCRPQVTLDGKGEVLLKGIEKRVCSNEEEALSTIFEGLHNRSTNRNVHVVLSIYARHQSLVDSECETKEAVLHLVDLAGIQRGDELSPEQRREVQVVNRSLSMLEQVILCLGNPHTNSSGEAVKVHIPYRQSKLTILLKDCIGGTSFTSLIAHIYPEQQYLESSLSTLNFARRMMHLVTEPTINVVQDASTQIHNLQHQVADLKAELRMQTQLSMLQRTAQGNNTGSGENTRCNEPPHSKRGNNQSSTTTYGTDELNALHKKVQTYLDGSSSTIHIDDVREMTACFAYFRQLLEQKDMYINEIQSEAYTTRAQSSYQKERGNGYGGNRNDGDSFTSNGNSKDGMGGTVAPHLAVNQDSAQGKNSGISGNKGGNGSSVSSGGPNTRGLGGAHRRRAPSTTQHSPSTTAANGATRSTGKDASVSGNAGAGVGNTGDSHTPNVLDKQGGISYGVAGKAAPVNQLPQPQETFLPSSERDRSRGGGGAMKANFFSSSNGAPWRGDGAPGGLVGGSEEKPSGLLHQTMYSTSTGMPGTSGVYRMTTPSPCPTAPGAGHPLGSSNLHNLNGHPVTSTTSGSHTMMGAPSYSGISQTFFPPDMQTPTSPGGGGMMNATGLPQRSLPSILPSPTVHVRNTPPTRQCASDSNPVLLFNPSSTFKPSGAPVSGPPGASAVRSPSEGPPSRYATPPILFPPPPPPPASVRLEGDGNPQRVGMSDRAKIRAFEDYKKNNNGALQLEALSEDQDQLALLDRKLNRLWRQLNTIDTTIQEKAHRHRSHRKSSSHSPALLPHLSPYSGGGGEKRRSYQSPRGSVEESYQGSDEDEEPCRMTPLQLSVYHRATEDNIKAVNAERSHLAKQIERRLQAFFTNFLEWYARISGDTSSHLSNEYGGILDSAVGKQVSHFSGSLIGNVNSSSSAAHSGAGPLSMQGAGHNSGRSAARRGVPKAIFLDSDTPASGTSAGGVMVGADSTLPSLSAEMSGAGGVGGAAPLFFQLQDDRFLDAAERFDAMEMQRRTAQDPQSGAFYAAKKFVESKTRDQARVGNRAS